MQKRKVKEAYGLVESVLPGTTDQLKRLTTSDLTELLMEIEEAEPTSRIASVRKWLLHPARLVPSFVWCEHQTSLWAVACLVTVAAVSSLVIPMTHLPSWAGHDAPTHTAPYKILIQEQDYDEIHKANVSSNGNMDARTFEKIFPVVLNALQERYPECVMSMGQKASIRVEQRDGIQKCYEIAQKSGNFIVVHPSRSACLPVSYTGNKEPR